MGNSVIPFAMSGLIDIVTGICGVILCFWGYKAFKKAITCCGLVIGYQIGTFIGNFIVEKTGVALAYPLPEVIRIVFAIILGFLAFNFYKRAIVVTVTYFVAQFAYKAFVLANPDRIKETKDTLILMGICIVIGFAVGLLCLFVQKWAIIIVSSIGGAKLIATVVSKYIYDIAVVKDGAGWVVNELFKIKVPASVAISGLLLLILCILGIVIQVDRTKKV